MTRKIMSIIIALILIGVVAGVMIISDFNKNNTNYTDFMPITSVSSFVNGSNDFSFDLYKELIDENENIFFSPYSITTALSMVYEGAEGQTADEMASVLGIPEDDNARWDMMWSYQGHFNHPNQYYELSTANAYWVDTNTELKDNYINAIENYYWAYGEQMDFEESPERSANRINDWIEDETNNKIKDMIDYIDPETKLILTNAIYFQAGWADKFDPERTFENAFTKSDGSEVMIDMMGGYIEFEWASNSEAYLIKLPYENNETSMHILYPKENNIGHIEDNLDYEYIQELKNNLSSRKYLFSMPKFKLEQKYDLVGPLKNLGMEMPFSNAADFSGVSDTDQLTISQVLHQSYIEVDEEGTEAAAATVVNMAPGASAPISVDHPFIFFIEHEETGQILFMGKLENPGA